jgi:hypothetical protein
MAQPNEHDAAAARVLAGGADRDVAEIRGEILDFREQNTRVLNALREDLTVLRQYTEAGFARVDRGFVEMRRKPDAAAAGQQQVVGMLNTLITPAARGPWGILGSHDRRFWVDQLASRRLREEARTAAATGPLHRPG